MPGRSQQSPSSGSPSARGWAALAAHPRSCEPGPASAASLHATGRGPSAFKSDRSEASRHRVGGHVRVRLVQSGEAWSLVSPDGESVFQASGRQARRRCLEFACAEGVLALLS
jgi:hypothetical protein